MPGHATRPSGLRLKTTPSVRDSTCVRAFGPLADRFALAHALALFRVIHEKPGLRRIADIHAGDRSRLCFKARQIPGAARNRAAARQEAIQVSLP